MGSPLAFLGCRCLNSVCTWRAWLLRGRYLTCYTLRNCLCLGVQDLRQVHRLREHNVVLIELYTSCTSSLVIGLSVNFEADPFPIQDHISGVITNPKLANFLAFDISRLVHGQVTTVIRFLVVLALFAIEMGNAMRCHSAIDLA